MVAEIKLDGKPTETGETPFTSDNLAQRNLAIVQTDNPVSLITHTVEHSFEVELGQRNIARDVPNPSFTAVDVVRETVAPVQDAVPDVLSLDFTTTAKTIQMVKREAINLAVEELRRLEDPKEGETEQIIQKYVRRAESIVRQKNPLVFDPVDWLGASNAIDELLLRWNG